MSKRNRHRQLPSTRGDVQIVATHQQVRIAPLPSPEELAKFEQILPGLADRLVTMAEQNGHDRRQTNRTIRWATILGQIFAFVIMVLALGGGFYMVDKGKDAGGIAAIITAIAVPLGTFIYNRTRHRPPATH